MSRKNRSRSFAGLLMVLLGAWLLAVRFVPGLERWAQLEFTWPVIIIAIGVGLFFLGLLGGESDMAVPAAVVAGIGGLLYYQNNTGDWQSWAYAWSLIPGFVGIGVILAGLLSGNIRRAFSEGLRLLFISAVLFLVFSSFLGGPRWLGDYWPVLVILLGLWLLAQSIWPFRRT